MEKVLSRAAVVNKPTRRITRVMEATSSRPLVARARRWALEEFWKRPLQGRLSCPGSPLHFAPSKLTRRQERWECPYHIIVPCALQKSHICPFFCHIPKNTVQGGNRRMVRIWPFLADAKRYIQPVATKKHHKNSMRLWAFLFHFSPKEAKD